MNRYTVAKYGENARKVYLSVKWLVVIPAGQSLFTGILFASMMIVLFFALGIERDGAFILALIAGITWAMISALNTFDTHYQVILRIEDILEREARAIQTPVRIEVASNQGRTLSYTKLPPPPQMRRLAALTLDKQLKPTARGWADEMIWDKNIANEWQRQFAADGWLRQQGRGSGYEWTEAGLELLERYHSPAPND